MKTNLYFNPDGLKHDTGPGHPERPARLQTILDMTSQPPFDVLPRIEARKATEEEITRAHLDNYFYHIEGLIPDDGYAALDADTTVSSGSWNAALTAAGGVCQAVDDILAGKCTRAFCAVRPPGHHAMPENAEGFCIFSNIAIGALHALQKLKRVAVLDFDVHHGNGTDAIARKNPGFFFASTHQWPMYPGTGLETDNEENKIVNVRLNAGDGSKEFRAAWAQKIFPSLDAFKPELIFISAGFDAHRDDPLAQINIIEDDYIWITKEITALADRHCGGKIISVLEGGYNLNVLKKSGAAHLATLAELP